MDKKALLEQLAAIYKGGGIVLLTIVGLLAMGVVFTLAWDTFVVQVVQIRAINLTDGIFLAADYYLFCASVYVVKATSRPQLEG